MLIRRNGPPPWLTRLALMFGMFMVGLFVLGLFTNGEITVLGAVVTAVVCVALFLLLSRLHIWGDQDDEEGGGLD